MSGTIQHLEQYPTVSVIIPYFGNRHSDLQHCIQCVESQQYPAQKLEIVVVDNNSLPSITTDSLGTDRVSILHEPFPGSYAARNRGISSSSGAIVAFTDADCAPTSTWLKDAIQELAQLNLKAAIGGKIVFSFRSNGNPNIWELYDSLIHLRQQDYISGNKFAATANLIVPRHYFTEIGMFNQVFYSGGDREWGERLHSHGGSIVYSDTAIVLHRARSTAREVVAKNRRGVGAELIRVRLDGASRLRILWVQLNLLGSRLGILIQEWQTHRFGYRSMCKLFSIFIIVYIARCLEALRLMCGGLPLR
jgi:glycosyltransferase involved in cell wall biosynthesis